MATPILVPRASISITRVVMGLANFTTYTFTVATYNEDGLGPQTQTATVRTPETCECKLQETCSAAQFVQSSLSLERSDHIAKLRQKCCTADMHWTI